MEIMKNQDIDSQKYRYRAVATTSSNSQGKGLVKQITRHAELVRKKLDQKIKLGFGQGHGSGYKSWLQIRRKNSSPNSNQVVSWMPSLGRVAHYFSRGEYYTALLLLWLGVQDVREQFPLWPIAHPHPLDGAPGAEIKNLKWSRGLIGIANEAGIEHGVEVGTRIPYVATVDLMVTVALSDGLRLFGLSSKAISSADVRVKERTLERLEMERRFMLSLGERYYVTNFSLVPTIMAGQLESWLDCATLDCAPELIPLVNRFADFFKSNDFLSIAEIVKYGADELGISIESAWLLFRHCAWNLKIDIDPTVLVVTSHPMKSGGLALRKAIRQKLFGEDWS